MKTLELISSLYHQEAGIRRQAVLVIGMVEETGALMALQQRIREEPDDAVKKMIMWAGKRVQDADDRGFSTIDAIFDYFKIDREIQSGIDPEEAELLRHQNDMAGSLSSGGMFKDIKLGSTLTADAIQTGPLSKRRVDKKSMLRVPPLQPTDTDVSRKIKQLANNDDSKRQKNAALALREMNNPEALPYMALTFFRNANPENQDIIEKCGKALYWNTNYYDMTVNGRLNLEIARRRREGGYVMETASEPTPGTETAEMPKPSVTDILNQAQSAKRKRRRR